MICIYNIILLVFLIPAIIFFFFNSIKNPSSGIFFKLKERLGFLKTSENLSKKEILWFHGASVGEVKALEPLIRHFRNYSTLLTVLTPQGRRLAEKNKSADYLSLAPLDFNLIINNFFKKMKPKALILFETEIWPGLIDQAKRRNLKVIVVNGRISGASYPFYKFFRFFWKNILNKADLICARSNEDAERFKGIGCTGKIEVTGNIKYDRDISIPSFTREDAMLSDLDVVFAAGSTREEEEKILADVFVELKMKFPNLKILIAPRRIDRTQNLIKLLKYKNINFVRYSEGIKKPYECLIIDTFGDLVKFYAISDITFVGKSLINRGGQNPIEPASYSKPVLFGPYMQNFQTEADALVNEGGGFYVKNKEELSEKVSVLLSDKMLLKETGERALQAVLKQRGALKRTVSLIENLI